MSEFTFEPSPLSSRISTDATARDRDLGFGSVVSRTSQRRLLNRDGSFNVRRSGIGMLESLALYHQFLTISWSGFLTVVAILYLILNLLFAVAYLACGPGALMGPGAEMLGGRFGQAFFFSIQTFATIGYGQIAPNGTAANLIVTLEALVGLMYQALATGLLFARFSRPTASIRYSRRAVIAPYGDGQALMFRIVNRRRNEIIQIEAQVLFSVLEADGRGGTVRRYTLLPLERNRVTFFPLSWTIVHPIDSASPLAGKSAAELQRSQAEILVLLSGIDETFEQSVHSRSSYRAEEIVWNSRFRSMFVPESPQTPLSVDVSLIDDVEPA
ncbi:MAG TPA: ion channel [Vicinamibacterales bacterium]|nr:ion channel [Vicinamibacterales bacterium]